MYATLRDVPTATGGDPVAAPGRARLRAAIGRTVLLLGLTSLLTDMSTEMVNAVLPLYLVETLGFTPFQYGLLNGLYQGVTAVVRLVGGYASDRWGRHRDVAAVGYVLSALARVGLVTGGASVGVISSSLAADRIGKGIRTAPRDAMLAAAARPADLGLVFGVHRTMDTAGALLGPFTAFAVLAAAPDAYDLVFVASACVAVIGVAALLLLVEGRPGAASPPADPADAEERVPTQSVSVEENWTGPGSTRPGTSEAGTSEAGSAEPGAADRSAPPRIRDAFALLRGRGFATLVLAGFALSLVTVGDGFVYLRLQGTVDVVTAYFPLLAAGTASVYLLLAVPFGRLADRVGRRRVLFGGYACLSATYALLLLPAPGVLGLCCALGMLGVFYAATDGVLAAAASALLPPASRTSGLALLATAVALGQLAASAGFGWLWTVGGATYALWITCAASAVVLPVSAVLLRAGRGPGTGPGTGDGNGDDPGAGASADQPVDPALSGGAR